MANRTKFASVNLNKSYGQPAYHRPGYSSSYGQAATSRVGTSGHGSGGGGGMVVLSRPRSSQKTGPKLSVPPPLNLPSLRKEHSRFDLSGSGGGSAAGGGSGSGSRPTSSGMGWTKPSTISLQEKDGNDDTIGRSDADDMEQNVHVVDSATRGSSVYMPPSARLHSSGLPVFASPQDYPPSVEKATVLRGEDFPSLKSALPTTSGLVQKQKDSSHQKQKQKHLLHDESLNEQRDSFSSTSPVHMRPQVQTSHHSVRNYLNKNVGDGYGLGGSNMQEQARKQEEYFPGPLPLVSLNPRSDWADDERDTGHGFANRSREQRFSKSEAYWDREFDMPRSSLLPHKPPHNMYERWGQHNETGKGEVFKVDSYRRDVRTPSREGKEGNSWRSSPLAKDGFNVQEVVNDRNSLNREIGKENKYIPPLSGDSIRDTGVKGYQDFAFGMRDLGNGQGERRRNHSSESFGSRGTERSTRERYGSEQSSRYKGDSPFKNNSVSKSSSSGGKGFSVHDPLPNFGREKRIFSKNERPYTEDPFLKDFGTTGFDERDPFSSALVGVIKRKKDVAKQADFHDPVRESFEAELERVQKMQELERQRVIEEQERALEQARREEEERQRLIREEEDRQRRLEEEAREAAWRAEQERLEAIRRAEEQKIAREEEKQRILIEEERRKQAAKQKLLELEARIAKRQTEAPKGDNLTGVEDEKVSAMVREKDVPKAVDMDNWEHNDRMVESITASISSDSSHPNRSFEMGMGSRPQPSRENSSDFLDRGKHVNSWRRDVVETGSTSSFLMQEQENGQHSPRRNVSVSGRAFPRKEFYGGGGYISSRTYFKGGVQDSYVDDDFSHLKGPRWNPSMDGDPYSRNMEIDSEFHDNLAEKYSDVGWGQSPSRGHAHAPYPERLYPNSEADELYSYGRSRYSMRQPRVLPPPSIASMHKTSFRQENECLGPPPVSGNDMHYNHTTRSEPTMQTRYYSSHTERLGPSEILDVQQETTLIDEQKLDKDTTPRCDSQSSLSVSSPPNSPTHFSHDDLEEPGDSPVMTPAAEGNDIHLSGNESLNVESGKDIVVTSSSTSEYDDEENTLENNGELQEQEEYDEDEDGYREEDEVHDGEDENIDLTREFEDIHIEENGSSYLMDNLVLGFDEGVAVEIPGDEFESSSKNEKNTFGAAEGSIGIIEDQEYVNGIRWDGKGLQQPENASHVNIDGSSTRIQETDKPIQNSMLQCVNNDASCTSLTSNLLGCVSGSISSSPRALHTESSLISMTSCSSSGETITSTVTAGSSQADLPVKLQFGLFSGPSLIPSPVPAIQIGSIQMPLHLHSPVGQSLTHIHPSQSSLFQLGQVRYTSPISQGILPMAPQSMSFVQPNAQTNYNLNQHTGGPLPIQLNQYTSGPNLKDDDKPGLVLRPLDLCHGNVSRDLSSLSAGNDAENSSLLQKSQAEISCAGSNISYVEDKGHFETVVKSCTQSSNQKGSEGKLQASLASSQSLSSGKDSSGSRAQGVISGGKGKKYVYSVRNSGLRSSIPLSEGSRSESGGFQRRTQRIIRRTEFRVRENVARRHSSNLGSYNNMDMDDKSNFNGRGVGNSVRSGSKKSATSNKPLKQVVNPECSSSSRSQEIDSRNRSKGIEKEGVTKSQITSQPREANLKRNILPEEDVDAPLQSGVVCVFKQPGIEAPSDEDDFIQVRSKRQMLNARREQREKEIKAKSRVPKAQRRPRPTAQNSVVSSSSNKISASLSGETRSSIQSDLVVSEGLGLVHLEASMGSSTMVTQPLAPIGTPATIIDADSDKRSHTVKSLQTGSVSSISSGGKNLGSGLIFETKNKVLDDVQTPLGSWGNARINQQVMALTQNQLDEAMKPALFDAHVASVGDHTSSVSEPIVPSSSILSKDKSFSSTTSPINSLLAGEKIQFGAVTSPTVLPSSSRAVSHGIGAPGSGRSDNQISHNLSAAEKDCKILFEKGKHSNDSCVRLEDREAEAEAEAAASAVAVAAIGSDEIVGNVLDARSDIKRFGGAEVDGMTGGGVTGDQQLTSQSKAEESLSVALPADLSVETPPLSLWPPLPSPHNSSNQMVSHFPGGPPSHYPIFDMNPILGGPIFAFGPHDESAGTQSQSQKSTASGSGPLGSWQQCHSGVDSFYGPPAGFTGPFISPPGGIPGVQGPPHMVVYNHFAPVGQFGQVGLSFMGTTYIPSGKQPDWKHNPTSSAMGIGEGDLNNTNMISAQRNTSNMSAPVTHLSPGSSLLPMASPLAMFDVSPFQSAPDISVQARWSHVPASPLHSVPLSLPLQKQSGVLPSQFSHGHPADQSLIANRFSESRTSTPSEGSRNFPVAGDATVSQLPDELGLVDSSGSAGPSLQIAVNKSSSGTTIADAGKTGAVQNGSSTTNNGQSTNASKTRSLQQKNLVAHQYSQSTGYNYQRGGLSQKNSSGGEWSHHRIGGFHGRNQSLGTEKGFPSPKMKQIYVAKQSASALSTAR